MGRQEGLEVGEDVREEVQGGWDGQLPPQFLEDQHLHVLELRQGDAAVGEDDQLVEGERAGVGQLGGDTEAGSRQELELGGGDGHLGQDGVEIPHRTEEDLGGAVVLADLQHPVCHDLPVVGQDVGSLHLGDDVPGQALVVALRHQEVVQHSGAQQHSVTGGSDEGWPGWPGPRVLINLHHVLASGAPLTY